MNEYINPPCNSSLATLFLKGMNSKEKIEVGRTSPFTEPDEVVEEGAFENEEGMVWKSVSLDPLFVPIFAAAEREGMECVRRTLGQLGGENIIVTEPVFDADDEGVDTFLDLGGGGQRDEGAESEGFTFTDALLRVNLVSETLLGGLISSSKLPLC